MFGLYISNDTLTCLLGCFALWQAHRYIKSTSSKQLVLLAAVTGLGLLTRLTFLAFIPPLLVLILWVSGRRSPWRAVGSAIAFLSIALTLGSYKFVENYLHYGNPFLNSMDDLRLDPIGLKSYRGMASYTDFNIVALLEKPTLSRDRSVPDNRWAYPLLLYGSFWYQEIPESNWTGNLHKRLRYLGSAIYAVALIPTFFFFAGLAALGKRLPEFVRHFDPGQPADQRLLTYYVAVSSLLMILAILLLAMNKYHLWSIMQGRYLFPAVFGGVSAFSVGIETCGRSRLVALGLNIGMMLLVGLFVLYFASEIGLRLMHA
jgi:4-amino-4-deoxy-L-arabinose transferase-like glycosyltransferase